jgi:hypothetical protein
VIKLIKIAMALFVGMLVTGNAYAYYVSGGVVYHSDDTVATGTYTYGGNEGYMGNVNLGLPGGADIQTRVLATDPTDLVSPLNYVVNNDAVLSDTVTMHWYKFSLDVLSGLGAYYELNTGIQEFEVQYFYESQTGDGDFFTRVLTSAEIATGFIEDWNFEDFPAGEVLMRITGKGTTNGANGYKVRLVPLPPAVLLFVSALAGFGVIGRKNRRKTVS